MKNLSLLLIAFLLLQSSALAQNWQLQYDGLDDFCNLPDGQELFSNLDVFTVEFWIKVPNISDGPIFIGSGPGGDILFAIDPTGITAFSTNLFSVGVFVQALPGAFPADGMWHHLACVRSGPGAGQGIIYIDGVDQTNPAFNTPGAAVPLSGNLTFGVGLSNFFFNGAMDDLRIWNVERSQTQINNNKDIKLTGSESGLIGYWQFNEGSGQTIIDSQTNGTTHDGTLGADGSPASDDPTRIQDSGLPLPVELTSFTAYVNAEGNVVLNWSTATELNNQMFEIERRSKEGQFITIGYVEGYGTTTEPQEYSYIDNTVGTGIYYYRLKQIDFGGQYEYSDEIEVEVNGPLTFALEQNYPNPFNPSTLIKYSVPENGSVKLSVYNLVGEEVSVLVNQEVDAGFYEATFNAADFPSGIYFYKLQSDSFVETKKMVLMK
ncbi:MAG: T9SS type A sorting domain-containing protein [Bacteroidetes bacterium]|nr:T9SS type A sorting domain-containing protein [Bacteroidota bacterium]